MLLGFANGFSGYANDAATDAGFHAVSFVIAGIGVLVLLMTVLDSHIPTRAGR